MTPRDATPADPPAPIRSRVGSLGSPAGAVQPRQSARPLVGGLVSRRWLEAVVLVGLLVFYVSCCVRFAWTTSPVFDEPGFLRSGYGNLTANVPKTATGNLLFAPTWLALPLPALHPVLPTAEEIRAVEAGNRDLGRLFLFHPGNDWRTLLHAARVMNILLGLALAALVWRSARTLFGPFGGGVTLAFFCFSPLMISNSAIATTDIAVTLWFLVALGRIWALLHRVSPANVITCGAAAGLLLVTKISGLILLPVATILFAVRLVAQRPLVGGLRRRSEREITGRLRQFTWLATAITAAALVGVGVIWLCYAPSLTIFADPRAAWPWADFAGQPSGPLGAMAEHLHQWRILPDPLLFDVRLFESSASTRRAFLLGDYSIDGWWYFFPAAWFFKNPLSFAAALALGAGVLVAPLVAAPRKSPPLGLPLKPDAPRAFDLYAVLPLVVFGAVYLAAALASILNIGVRHLLPIQPILFILTGAASLAPRPVWRRLTLAALLVLGAFEVGDAAPEFMAYCNPVAGGTANGHRVLVDSSYEWGQDLPAVERWLETRARRPGPKPPVFFSYFGNADLSRFKIDAVLLPQFPDLRPNAPYTLRPGTYIISATMLHTLYGPVMGPWRPSYENAYQKLTHDMQRLAALLPDTARAMEFVRQEGEDVWVRKNRLYDALRFARLCAYLRPRPPDVRITAGILVYELSLGELERALVDPPVELRTGYQVKGSENVPQAKLPFLQ